MEVFLIRNCERIFKIMFLVTIFINIICYFYLPSNMIYFQHLQNGFNFTSHKSIALLIVPFLLCLETKLGRIPLSTDVLKMAVSIFLLSINFYLIYINL